MITGRRGCGGDEVRQSLRGKVEVEGKISGGGQCGKLIGKIQMKKKREFRCHIEKMRKQQQQKNASSCAENL